MTDENHQSDETTQVILPEGTGQPDINFDLSGVNGQGGFNIAGQSSGDSTVVPVVGDGDLLNNDIRLGNNRYWVDGELIVDETIRNLIDNTIDYSPEIGDWLLQEDDLVPSIISMFEGLIMGSEGLMVSPADPSDESDMELVEHMQRVYTGYDDSVEHVNPADVVRQILMDNARYAISVLRSSDLQAVDIGTLDVVTDGKSGETVYIQEATDYETVSVSDNGEVTRREEQTERAVGLKVGQDVFDVKLYRTPPIKAVADEMVNKLQMKRFKARKAEIASIGGIYIQVNPPAWLPEEMYFETIPADENPIGNSSIKKLELAVQRDINAALETLEQYQTATIMSIPEHWEVNTIEVPEMEETFDDMIDGYNQSISRRMLLPFDLMDLAEKGQMLSAAVAAWQREITDVFNQFAAMEADDHNINGTVEHKFPSLEVEDEKLLIRSLAYAGLLGLSQEEARGIVNSLEGVDLDEDVEANREMPPLDDLTPGQKEQQTRDMLQQQGGSPEGTEDITDEEALDPEMPKEEGDQQIGAAAQFSETDVVETDSGTLGLVLDVLTSDFEWPGGDGTTTVEASDSNPAYIVAVESGGSDVFRTSDLSPASFPDDEENKKDLDEVEITAQLTAANIPGVDDPEVGFGPGEPEGWTRLSYLSAYASVGGSFTTCVGEMSGDVRSPKRWCAALKDEVYGTELWRGGWE